MRSIWLSAATAVVFACAQGALVDVFSPCCQEGIKWAGSEDFYRCDAFYNVVPNISDTDRAACMSIVQICCMKQAQITSCESGKQMALEGQICAARDSEPGAEQLRECCHCCRLGLEAKTMSAGNCPTPGLGQPCDRKFLECCKGEKSANVSFLGSSSGPQDQQAPQTTATTTVATVTVKDTGILSNTTAKVLTLASANCQTENPCSQRCVEQIGGGVQCRCYEGYRLAADLMSCDDINECSEGTGKCAPSQICVNTPGRFTCMSSTCPVGYELDPDSGRCRPGLEECAVGFKYSSVKGKCEDLNECGLGIDSCGYGERCENTIGSYTCRRHRHCGTGYTLDDVSQRCQDNDECTLGTHNCASGYKCQNTQGSFRCVPKPCEKGYKFDRVRGECFKIQCPTGLKPNWALKCEDINECKEQGPSICKRHERCVNTRGSYYCRSFVNCPPGYEATENSGCQDVDECTSGIHKCKLEQQCINRQGTYFCQCPRGMRHDSSGSCVDVDECSYGASICPSNSKCVNTVGSYTCDCVDGLVSDGNDRCADVDECQQEGICQQSCVNVLGTFFCSCNRGYQLRDDKRSCEDIDECTQFRGRGGRTGVCGGRCINLPGSYRCECSDGWRLKADSRTCEDINECREGTAMCDQEHGMCINTRGGYKCPTVRCPEGFIKTNGSGGQKNSVRCKRVAVNCPECRRGLISRTYNFISFAPNVIVPAPLFSMTGSRLVDKFYKWQLELVQARPLRQGVIEATPAHFSLERNQYFARVTLIKRIEGPQDVVLKLSMNVTSYYKGFEGMAESRIYLYVTDDDDY